MKWLVSAECVSLHQAVVEAEDEADATRAYNCDEWVEDLGHSEPCDEDAVVFSVEEYVE